MNLEREMNKIIAMSAIIDRLLLSVTHTHTPPMNGFVYINICLHFSESIPCTPVANKFFIFPHLNSTAMEKKIAKFLSQKRIS